MEWRLQREAGTRLRGDSNNPSTGRHSGWDQRGGKGQGGHRLASRVFGKVEIMGFTGRLDMVRRLRVVSTRVWAHGLAVGVCRKLSTPHSDLASVVINIHSTHSV